MKVYNKLVRDKIQQILKRKGLGFKTHIANKDEYKTKLFSKLREEVDEFLADPNIEELADILEVLYSIFKFMETKKSQVEIVRRYKKKQRGGFKKRIILEHTSDK